MSEHETIKRETVAAGAPSSTTQLGREEAGGALGGAAGGAVVGAVVGGPVGAIVGGAIGAATGATAGAFHDKHKDESIVVTTGVKT